MEAVLKYQLPEEKEDYEHAVKGITYYCVIWEVLQKIRSQLKYSEDTTRDAGAEWVREIIWEELESEGLTNLF